MNVNNSNQTQNLSSPKRLGQNENPVYTFPHQTMLYASILWTIEAVWRINASVS